MQGVSIDWYQIDATVISEDETDEKSSYELVFENSLFKEL